MQSGQDETIAAAGRGSAPPAPTRLRWLDRGVGRVLDAGLALSLPLSLLLFLQWPLRELVQAYSRQANDLAQCLFAVYVSLAITYATRRRSHLATDVVAQRLPPRWRRRLARTAALLALLPWSAFMLYAAWPTVALSVATLESFPETFNPGYFIVKLSLLLLGLLVLAQALIELCAPGEPPAP